jgi:hypothetical protein
VTVISDSKPTVEPTDTPSPGPTYTPTPSIPQSLNPEDINGDKAVNMTDVIIIAHNFNQFATQSNRACDLNNDGVINMSDVFILAMKFNTVVG